MDGLTFRHTADLELSDDGRTVEGRIVPFGEPATVVDRHPKTGQVEEFTETFDRDAFDAMIAGLSAGPGFGKVTLVRDHRPDTDSMFGYATQLEAKPDGAYGVFRLYQRADLDLVRSIIEETHRGLSVGFKALVSKVVDGVVHYRKVHLDHVAVTPTPAYAGAVVTAVREDGLAVPELERPRLQEALALFPDLR